MPPPLQVNAEGADRQMPRLPGPIQNAAAGVVPLAQQRARLQPGQAEVRASERPAPAELPQEAGQLRAIDTALAYDASGHARCLEG